MEAAGEVASPGMSDRGEGDGYGDDGFDGLSSETDDASSGSDDGTSGGRSRDPERSADPTCQLCRSRYRDWEVGFEHWGLLDSVLQPLDLCKSCYRDSIPPDVDQGAIVIRDKRSFPLCLFIIMEYCESTLTEAVRQCGGEDATIWSFFAQCVQGLATLHSRDIIHRDIKPGNIFVRKGGSVKIGDLGLATYVAPGGANRNGNCHGHENGNGNGNGRHYSLIGGGDGGSSGDSAERPRKTATPRYVAGSKSSEVGTFLYTAPEVRTGRYDEKCDVYSLGVVLLEMFSDFGTAMERADVLTRLREDMTLPGEWEEARPAQARLVLSMVAPNPSDRPSCAEVLDHLAREGIWAARPSDSSCERAVEDLTARVESLRAELERKDAVASRLRSLLDESGISYGHIL